MSTSVTFIEIKTPQGSGNSSVLPDPLAVVMQQEGTVRERERESLAVTSLPLQYALSSGD